jgi:hypothetical protein
LNVAVIFKQNTNPDAIGALCLTVEMAPMADTGIFGRGGKFR